MQVLFGSLVRDEAKERFIETPKFIPITQPTKVKKPFRIRTGLEPVIAQHRLFLQSKINPLAMEIQGFPTAQTCDLVDCLETIINRVAPKFLAPKQRNVKVEQYAKYLRETNCPPHLLKQKIAEYQLKHRIAA
jgi:hypothetical protein